MAKSRKSKTIADRVINIFLGILAFLSIGLCAMSLLIRFTGKSIAGYSMLYVPTESMVGTIPKESYILVKDCNGDDVNVGDVITFVSLDPSVPNGGTVTHRVIAINNDGSFETKGDNNLAADYYSCPKDNVRAKFISRLRVMTFVSKVYATPAGYSASIITLIVIMGVSIVKDKNGSKLSKKEMDELVAEEVKKLEEEFEQKNK